jgi:HK97 family phage major capsid protein
LAKFTNAVTFTTANSPVKTLATFIQASRQALDDFSELGGFLTSSLPYYVNRAEETQLLSGDNTGENLNGLITQATAFNMALLSASAGYTRIDQIGAAIQQVNSLDEIEPSFVFLNTADLWKIRRTKDSYGRYILGDPGELTTPNIWGLTAIGTNSMAAGTFLVGSGDSAAAEIRDRMEMQVDISTEDSDNFQKNMVTVRAEKRLVLCVMRPASFITGTFASSPVGV